MRPFDYFVGDERDYIAKKIEEVFTEGAANAEAHFTAKDGTRTSYYFTGHKIQMDGKTRLIGIGIHPYPLRKPPQTPPGNHLYRNDGKGRFTDVTQQAHVSGDLFSMAAVAADRSEKRPGGEE